MTYLELAQKAIRKVVDAGRLPLLKAKRPREESEESEKSPVGMQEDDDRETCRLIERDLGLPERSLTLFPPSTGCKGCSFCRE